MSSFWQAGVIRLRCLEPGDAAHFTLWAADSLQERSLDHVGAPPAPARIADWVERQARRSFTHEDFNFLIETLDGVAVGTISTHACNLRTGTFSHAVSIAADHRRSGFARAAIRLILRHYFGEGRYQKSTVSIHADNTASLGLHGSLGYVEEGRLRRMVYTGAAFLDEVWMGITAEEFARTDAPA